MYASGAVRVFSSPLPIRSLTSLLRSRAAACLLLLPRRPTPVRKRLSFRLSFSRPLVASQVKLLIGDVLMDVFPGTPLAHNDMLAQINCDNKTCTFLGDARVSGARFCGDRGWAWAGKGTFGDAKL